jgi:hypothetical protein
MTRAQIAKEERGLFKYQVRLLIKHPNIGPTQITSSLGLTPSISAIAGSERKTPAGTILPGVHKVNLWGYSFGVKGNRLFFSDVTKMIDTLEPHKVLLVDIANSGGSTELIVHLPGAVNIGDIFPWQEMERLSALRIDLGLEVFPKFD